ncbi:MAG: FHA domain-containing protein [Gammaproteobacteria bacterium]
MGKLVLSLNGAVQGEYKLERERVFIGRKPENEIQVDNLAVSGKHTLIVTILDDSFLEDLGSTNGTYVNGKLIRKKHALSNGDVVGIGKHELSYINEHATADDEEFEKTMIVKPGSAIAAAALAEAAEKAVKEIAPGALTATVSALPLGKIRVLNGPVAGKELPLTKALITLGRPGSQVAVISRRSQGYFLTHIEGKNDYGPLYPIVNGEPIGPRAFSLQDRDIVEIAGIKMEFTLNE